MLHHDLQLLPLYLPHRLYQQGYCPGEGGREREGERGGREGGREGEGEIYYK